MDIIDTAYKTVHGSKHGGALALSTRMGMSNNVLNSKVNPNNDTHHLRLDEAVTVMELTDDHGIMHAIAARLGGVYCRVDASDAKGCLLMTALSTTSTQGDVMQELLTALKDGRISRSERAGFREKMQIAMASMQSLSNLVDHYCDNELPTETEK